HENKRVETLHTRKDCPDVAQNNVELARHALYGEILMKPSLPFDPLCRWVMMQPQPTSTSAKDDGSYIAETVYRSLSVSDRESFSDKVVVVADDRNDLHQLNAGIASFLRSINRAYVANPTKYPSVDACIFPGEVIRP